MPDLERGEISELIACAELLGMGYEVFKSINPRGPVDLVIRTAGGEVLFVEVKTAYKGQLKQRVKLDSRVSDVLALVNLDTYEVEYQNLRTFKWGHTPLRCISDRRLIS